MSWLAHWLTTTSDKVTQLIHYMLLSTIYSFFGSSLHSGKRGLISATRLKGYNSFLLLGLTLRGQHHLETCLTCQAKISYRDSVEGHSMRFTSFSYTTQWPWCDPLCKSICIPLYLYPLTYSGFSFQSATQLYVKWHRPVYSFILISFLHNIGPIWQLQNRTAPKAQCCLKPAPQPTMQHLFSVLIQWVMSAREPGPATCRTM